MHGASWSAATSGVSLLSVRPRPESCFKMADVAGFAGMVGDAAQDGTTTDSTSAFGGAAQALSGDRFSRKSASRSGNATATVLAGTQGTSAAEANEATVLTSIAQPAVALANVPVQAFGTDADSRRRPGRPRHRRQRVRTKRASPIRARKQRKTVPKPGLRR